MAFVEKSIVETPALAEAAPGRPEINMSVG